MTISKTNNIRFGFSCPNCRVRLKTFDSRDLEQKGKFFTKTLAPGVLAAIIFISVRIFNKATADFLIPFLIAAAAITMMVYFYKYLDKTIVLVVDEEFEKQFQNNNL